MLGTGAGKLIGANTGGVCDVDDGGPVAEDCEAGKDKSVAGFDNCIYIYIHIYIYIY